ncbi:MAG: LemA family protein [Thermodesulfobacteriota bacterium]
MLETGIIFGLLGAIVLLVIVLYNKLIILRNRYKNAFAQIDVQLQRRYDLIPNLVEIAKGYLAHERETLEAVITARNGAASAARQTTATPTDPQALRGLFAADNLLTGALSRLFAVAESYPDLKANQTMMQLTEELGSTENRIAFARQAFNDAVMRYNTTREQIPTNIVAVLLGFAEAPLFEVNEARVKTAPQVSFS